MRENAAHGSFCGDMVRDGFTIRIFVPDGDPEDVRIVDRMTSTGVAIAFPDEG